MATTIQSTSDSLADTTRAWYRNYYSSRGDHRNDLRTNRGVLYQYLATEASVVRATYSLAHEPDIAVVLDVGCGDGADISHLMRLRYCCYNITGIDIQAERIAAARRRYPNVRFHLGDASSMEFGTETFDLVFESTMFATLPDERLATAIARDMIRVCKTNGYLMLVDWRTPKPRDSNYRALSSRRAHRLFNIGHDTTLITTARGALVPPVGRFFSRFMPSAYFLIAACCPFLVGQVTYVLRKTASGRHDDTPGVPSGNAQRKGDSNVKAPS